MRTFLLIVGGLATLGGSLLVARWYGAGWRGAFADVGKFFIPICCLKSLDRRQAGRIFNRRGVTDLFGDLQHSCEYRCALVVAILRVVAPDGCIAISASGTKVKI